MEMSRPSTPSSLFLGGNNHNHDQTENSLLNNNNNSKGCESDASTSSSSWPLTELTLETPERQRMKFMRKRISQNNINFMSPPRSTITIKSPKTPKLVRLNQNEKPGANLINTSPSPLRRFKISQSSTPLTDKFAKTTSSGIEYRFRGNETLPIITSTPTIIIPKLPLSNIQPNNLSFNLNHTSTTNTNTTTTTDDSGFYSNFEDSFLSQNTSSWPHSSIYDDCSLLTENSFADPFSSENLWDNDFSNDSFISPRKSLNEFGENQFAPPIEQRQRTSLFKNQGVGVVEKSAVATTAAISVAPLTFFNGNSNNNLSPAPSISSISTTKTSISSSAGVANVTVSTSNNKLLEKEKSSNNNANEDDEDEAKVIKIKQKTLEEKIFYELDKYHDKPFNIEFAKNVNMTEFRKLKLMSSLTSNYYKTVLGRSKDQLQITRDAHKHLNSIYSKRVNTNNNKDRK